MNKIEEQNQKRRIVKDNPFIRNNIKDSEYWLGFIAADGFISGTKIGISLKSTDIDHLYKFKKFLGYEVSIKKRIMKSSNRNNHEICEIYFRSQLVSEYLISLGIIPKKSITLNYKGIITNDFLRGVIDGDGCIRYRGTKSGSEILISSGSEIFANQLKDYITKQFNVYCSIRIDTRSFRKTPLYTVSIYGGTYNVLSIYENADTYLTRKYFTATTIRNNRKTTP